MNRELIRKKASDYLDDAVMEKQASRAFTRHIMKDPQKIMDYMSDKGKGFNIRSIINKIKEEEAIRKQISTKKISPSKGSVDAKGLFRKLEETNFFDAMTRNSKKRDLDQVRDFAAYKKKIFDYEEVPFIARNPHLKKQYDFTTSKKEFRFMPPVSKSIKTYLEISKVPETKQTHKHKPKDTV